VIPRNHDNQALFQNAEAGENQNFSEEAFARTCLHYPHSLIKPMTIRG